MELTWLLQFQILSESAVAAPNANSEIFIAYVILSLIIKRAAFLAAFFISWLLFNMKIFDVLLEHQLYLIIFVVYTYVIFKCETIKSRIGCGILLILSIILSYDAYFYGVNGRYGEAQTVVYNNIEHLSLCAHFLFICSLIPFERIRNGLRSIIDLIGSFACDSAYMLLLCYNKDK